MKECCGVALALRVSALPIGIIMGMPQAELPDVFVQHRSMFIYTRETVEKLQLAYELLIARQNLDERSAVREASINSGWFHCSNGKSNDDFSFFRKLHVRRTTRQNISLRHSRRLSWSSKSYNSCLSTYYLTLLLYGISCVVRVNDTAITLQSSAVVVRSLSFRSCMTEL